MEVPAKKAPLVLLAALIVGAALMLGGCGANASNRTVKLSVTAPTDGATVIVSHVYVFGSVDPPNAAVVVSGRRTSVTDGQFNRNVVLHHGLNHISLVATSPGRLGARVTTAVRSETSGHQVASSPVREAPPSERATEPVKAEGEHNAPVESSPSGVRSRSSLGIVLGLAGYLTILFVVGFVARTRARRAWPWCSSPCS